MRVTVLGAAASHAAEGQACAGYLVETSTTRLLLDCGNGTLANLHRVADPQTIDAVFITHGHPDHYVDIYSMQAMLRYAPGGPAAPIRLCLPEGLFERMQGLLSDRGAVELGEAFEVDHIAPGVVVTIGDVTVTAHPVDHAEPTFALCVEGDGARLVYTSDTAPGERASHAACGADLLLAEATLPERYAGASPHLTARQAGELAQGAGAGFLVLTHLWPTNDRAASAREAREAFDGPVHVATEFDMFEVTPKKGR